MDFVFPQKVLFKHCDPAGIVFFPRYFEMINDMVEAFFDEALGSSFESMHPQTAVPTAEISTAFVAPSRHGDMLEFRLGVTRVGRTSLGLAFEARAGKELRLRGSSTLVHVAGGRPSPWPERLRNALAQYAEGDAA